MFLGICTAIFSSMANSVKFSAIVLVAEAELVPRASRRMRVELYSGIVFWQEPWLLFFDILSLSPTIRPCKIKQSIKTKQRNSKHKQLVAK